MAQDSSQNTYKKQNKVSLMGFFSEAPNFIAVTASALISGSLIMWVDFLSSLCNVSRTGFVAYLSKKLQSNLTYKYNYGIARLEAISSVLCDSIMIFGVLCIFACSVVQLVNLKEPSDVLLYVIILKVINVATDAFIFYNQYKIKKVNSSKVVQTEYEAYLNSMLFDLAVLVAVVVSCIFKNSAISSYIGPVASILISIYVLITSADRIKKKIKELTDETLEEDYQFQILKVLNKYHNRYEDFVSVNSHKIGDTVYIDLRITFKSDEKYENIQGFVREISGDLNQEIGNCKVSVLIDGDMTVTA